MNKPCKKRGSASYCTCPHSIHQYDDNNHSSDGGIDWWGCCVCILIIWLLK